MAIQIKRMKLPYEKRGRPFSVSLPLEARIERAGISPADGLPSIWYTIYTDDNDVVERKFVIVMDDETIDDNKAEHTGIWWEGNYAFHLYECSGLDGAHA